jgi:hypothetical protein
MARLHQLRDRSHAHAAAVPPAPTISKETVSPEQITSLLDCMRAELLKRGVGRHESEIQPVFDHCGLPLPEDPRSSALCDPTAPLAK